MLSVVYCLDVIEKFKSEQLIARSQVKIYLASISVSAPSRNPASALKIIAKAKKPAGISALHR